MVDQVRNGEHLNAKERHLHELGLASVLQSLHDELDAAVLQAYGWTDLKLPDDSDELLERLLALNLRRAQEEAAGQVRWLRPSFQQGGAVQAGIEAGPDDDGAQVPAASTSAAAKARAPDVRPWPAGLTEQIKAVADVLAQADRSLDLEDIAAHFTARGRWRDRLPTLVDTLVSLGRLRPVADGRWVDVRH